MPPRRSSSHTSLLQNLGHLIPDIHHYLTASIAPSTAATYRTAWNNYNQFCSSIGISPFPLSQICLLFYVVSLARRVCYATIKVYRSTLQYRSNLLGYRLHLSQSHQLFYLLRGIRRRPRRNPVTLAHLRLLSQFLQSNSYSACDRAMLFSACTLAFFGMLRSSEYTSPTTTTFHQDSTLQVNDIVFSPDLSIMSIFIKHSKTDPFRQGCTIRLANVASDICPVAALSQYLRYRRARRGPLFMFQSGMYLTRRHVYNLLRNALYLTRRHVYNLLRNALPHLDNINTHSFRIGGASAASCAGIPDTMIQVMGRWSSKAYLGYLRVSDVTVREVSRRTSTSSTCHRFWDSDTVSSKFV